MTAGLQNAAVDAIVEGDATAYAALCTEDVRLDYRDRSRSSSLAAAVKV